MGGETDAMTTGSADRAVRVDHVVRDGALSWETDENNRTDAAEAPL